MPSVGWNKESKTDGANETEKHGQRGLERVGGGLELSIKFAHLDDREQVINAGRGVGWSPMDLDVEQEEWESEGYYLFYQSSARNNVIYGAIIPDVLQSNSDAFRISAV